MSPMQQKHPSLYSRFHLRDRVYQELAHLVADICFRDRNSLAGKIAHQFGYYGCIAAFGKEIFSLPAYPTGHVIDPTGAGDSFAGGLLGYLANEVAANKTLSTHTLKNAIAAGTIMASFTIEDFSLNRIAKVTKTEVDQRLNDYRKMLAL